MLSHQRIVGAAVIACAAVGLGGCEAKVDSGYPEGARVVKEIGRPPALRFRNKCAAWNYETETDGVSSIWCDPGPHRSKPTLAGGALPTFADSDVLPHWSRANPGLATIRVLTPKSRLFTQLDSGGYGRISEFKTPGVHARAELLHPGRIMYSAAWLSFHLKCDGEWAWIRLWPVSSARPGVYTVTRAPDGVWTMRGAAHQAVAQATERCGMPPESVRNAGGPN